MFTKLMGLVNPSEAESGCLLDVKASEMAEDSMRECQVKGKNDEEMKILLLKSKGVLSALSPRCTHYGAPLAKGALRDGKVRCPWHGACFNAATGDIEDFPGLDSLHKFTIAVNDKDEIRLQIPDTFPATHKRVMSMCKRDCKDERTILVIGGGGAGANAVEALRQGGFTGRVVLCCNENCLPYDRPKLSKVLDSEPGSIALRSADFYSEHGIEVCLNNAVTKLKADVKQVEFADGSTMTYHQVLIATGSKPRLLDIPKDENLSSGIYYLRCPDDGKEIMANVASKNILMYGSSFIAMEVAASLVSKAASVTVVGRSSLPFLKSFGEKIGKAFLKLHQEKGVKFIGNSAIKHFKADPKTGALCEVILKDDSSIPVDLCIIAVGTTPNTEFLQDSGVELNSNGFIVVDEFLKSVSCTGVYAAGDVAAFVLNLCNKQWTTKDRVSIGHWQLANAQGRLAAHNMLNENGKAFQSVPFFWSQQYGKSLRFCGYAGKFDDVIIHGDESKLSFAAFFCCGDIVTGVASMNRDPLVAAAAEFMNAGNLIKKSDIIDSADKFLN